MSMDVFFQGFAEGDATEGGGDRAREMLSPFVVSEEPEHDFVQIVVGDGRADVYRGDDHMMANHISGVGPWEVLFDVARANGWVVMPVGAPVCLISEDQQAQLPEVLQEDVRVVVSGADLMEVVSGS